jgi:hypothetical protein
MPLKKIYRLDWWLCKDFQNSRQKNYAETQAQIFFVALYKELDQKNIRALKIEELSIDMNGQRRKRLLQ